MALSTFTPTQGVRAGFAYTLPPFNESDKRTGHVNRLQDAYKELAEAKGIYLESGAGPMYPSFFELQGTFLFLPNWLIATYGSGGNAALETALMDFSVHVLDGGKGTIVDTLDAGTQIRNNAGDLVNVSPLQRTATAVVSGDYSPERTKGPKATVACTIIIPSCEWTVSDGTTEYTITAV